jgi:hypothetical protein
MKLKVVRKKRRNRMKKKKKILKEYAEDIDDQAVNGALKGFLDLNEEAYRVKKISRAEYLRKKKMLEKAIASP